MDILHADDSVVVVNKPAGLSVLVEGWESAAAPYLVQMLQQQFGGHSQAGKQAIWTVHRLDKSTSGVMVFARTAEAHRALNIQFERHQAEKIYHAILQGSPAWDEKTARHPLRANVGHKHRTAVDSRHGKPAETEFRVMKRCPSATLVEVRIKTGRTHQIRAHAAAIGYPVVGDELYGATTTDIILRPALHACRLTITNPGNGLQETYTAPYPEDFSIALRRLKL